MQPAPRGRWAGWEEPELRPHCSLLHPEAHLPGKQLLWPRALPWSVSACVTGPGQAWPWPPQQVLSDCCRLLVAISRGLTETDPIAPHSLSPSATCKAHWGPGSPNLTGESCKLCASESCPQSSKNPHTGGSPLLGSILRHPHFLSFRPSSPRKAPHTGNQPCSCHTLGVSPQSSAKSVRCII